MTGVQTCALPIYNAISIIILLRVRRCWRRGEIGWRARWRRRQWFGPEKTVSGTGRRDAHRGTAGNAVRVRVLRPPRRRCGARWLRETTSNAAAIALRDILLQDGRRGSARRVCTNRRGGGGWAVWRRRRGYPGHCAGA